MPLTACLVVERSPPYLATTAREPPGSLAFFVLRPEERLPGHWPQADLYVLPARLFLELGPEERPPSVFAYGSAAACGACLAAGALDFLREPWEYLELQARASSRLEAPLPIGSLVFEPGSRRLRGPLAELHLGEAEARVLALLARPTGGLITRAALSYALWGELRPDSRAPDVLIAGLRKKLCRLGGAAAPAIEAVRGAGYRLLAAACG